MTTDEFLGLPDDGIERWLIDGQVREFGRGKQPQVGRDRFHSRTLVCVGTELDLWLQELPAPRGEVLGGDVGVRLMRDPDTTLGIDVVYVSPEVMAQQTEEMPLLAGVPSWRFITAPVCRLSGSSIPFAAR
jgi:hypothetical protein